jgi:hypothetical protein
MIDYLMQVFPFLEKFKPEIESLRDKYIKNYKMYELNEDIKMGNHHSLTEIFEVLNETNILEPRGWRHFDSSRLVKEKIEILKKFNLSQREIEDFLNAMPNSRLVNDTLRKINATPHMREFLTFKPVDEPEYKKLLNNMIHGKF